MPLSNRVGFPSYPVWSQNGQNPYGGTGSDLNSLIKQLSANGNPYLQYLQQVMQGGGGSRGALVAGAGGAPAFAGQQMGATDPTGQIANVKGFARKNYGPASQGMDQAYNDAFRTFQESRGGLQAGGVNPGASSFMKSFLGSQKAGDAGTLWGQLQGAETQMMDQALSSTAAYRKSMMDSLMQWGRDTSGAQAQDDQLRMTAAGAGLNQNQQALQAILTLVAPLMQRGKFSQPGLSGDDVLSFLSSLLAQGGP